MKRNGRMKTDVFDLQEIKSVGQSFLCFEIVLFFNQSIFIYLSFVIINGNLLKLVAITDKFNEKKSTIPLNLMCFFLEDYEFCARNLRNCIMSSVT